MEEKNILFGCSKAAQKKYDQKTKTVSVKYAMEIIVLQYLMGHSNTQITYNIYNHVNEERAINEVTNVAERRRNRA